MLKRFTMLLVAATFLTLGGRAAWAFSLLGPGPSQGNATLSWQTSTIGYNLTGDIGTPMNRGEGYRWNVPVITYAIDDSFYDYFGNRGAQEIEKALSIFNNLTNFSKMSTNLNEYPLRVERVNFRAQALNLVDLKSTTMNALLEELGLAEPERYIWTLRDRNVTTINNVTWTNYLVIQRNYDPVTQQPSAFVNGTLYTYDLREYNLNGTVAEAAEKRADPLAFGNTSVASSAPVFGHYFTTLSRDDVGGLKYNYGTNNIAAEFLLPDTQIVVTNSTEFQLKTDDLGLLSRQSTNSLLTPTQLTNAFFGIQLASVKTNLVLVYLTNNVGNNIVITPAVTNTYDYTYLNVVTNFTTNLALISIRTVEVTSNQFGLQTNILSQTDYTTNELAGSYYIITNGAFAYEIIAPFNVLTQEQKTIIITNINTSLFLTNNSPQARVLIDATNDLVELQQFSSTNNPAAVLARYPGLLITSTNIYLTNLVTQTFVSFTTNYVNDPAYTPGHLVTITNNITNTITGYFYTFGNVVTNQNYPSGFLTYQNIVVAFGSPSPYAPAGTVTLTTNTTVSTVFTTPYQNGTFYIVPTNLVGYNIIATNYESPTLITNTIQASSGVVSGVTLSNIAQVIRYRTNTVLLGEPILLQNPTNVIISTTGIRQEFVRIATNVTYKARTLQFQNSATTGAHVRRGVDKLNFRKIPFDSVLGRVLSPVTNFYTSSLTITNGTNFLTASGLNITNVYTTAGYRVSGQNYEQIQMRVVTTPDIVFVADDLGLVRAADGSAAPFLFQRSTTAGWQQNDGINGITTLGGPGVIRGPITISYNNLGPSVSHQTPGLLDESNPYFRNFTWGSYDGSGDEPTVYPVGTDIDALESLLLNGP